MAPAPCARTGGQLLTRGLSSRLASPAEEEEGDDEAATKPRPDAPSPAPAPAPAPAASAAPAPAPAGAAATDGLEVFLRGKVELLWKQTREEVTIVLRAPTIKDSTVDLDILDSTVRAGPTPPAPPPPSPAQCRWAP